MLREYVFVLLNEIVKDIGSMIDTGFGNSISIGSICALGIAGSIKSIFQVCNRYGGYYYKMMKLRAKACLRLCILSSLLSVILGMSLINIFMTVYAIEPRYESLLRSCIVAILLCLPFDSMNAFMGTYLVFTDRVKTCTVLNAIYYSLMIILDAVAVLVFHSTVLVILATGVCDLLYFLVAYSISGIRKEKYVSGELITVLKGRSSLFINRMISTLCIVAVNITATHIGTVGYALLRICRKSLSIGQTFVGTVHTIGVIHLRGKNKKLREAFRDIRKVMLTADCLFFITSFVTLFVVHGDVPLSSVLLPCMIANITSIITYSGYTIVYTKAVADGMQSELRLQAWLRVMVTIMLCVLSVVPHVGVFALMAYSTVTDLIIMLYSGWSISKKGE